MLVHRELAGTAAMRLRAHLAKCPACTERLREFEAVSRGFSEEIRDASMPRWLPGAWIPPGGKATAGLWLAAIAILGLSIAAAVQVQRHRAGPESRGPAVTTPCRPDLPNDRCR